MGHLITKSAAAFLHRDKAEHVAPVALISHRKVFKMAQVAKLKFIQLGNGRVGRSCL